MRISIWQQFASNHSAHFRLVGQFESPEWAAEVAEELCHVLRTIGAWWQSIDNYTIHDRRERQMAESGELTPPERQFSLEYGVPWWRSEEVGEGSPLDWVRGAWAANSVVVYDNLVFMEPPNDTWGGPVPFDAIMRELGGKVAADREDGGRIVMTISCVAPNEEVAEQMVSLVKLLALRSGGKGIIIQIPGIQPPFQGEGEVIRENNRIVYRNVDLYYQEYMQGEQRLRFPQTITVLVEYLKQQGCTEISYHFEQVTD